MKRREPAPTRAPRLIGQCNSLVAGKSTRGVVAASPLADIRFVAGVSPSRSKGPLGTVTSGARDVVPIAMCTRRFACGHACRRHRAGCCSPGRRELPRPRLGVRFACHGHHVPRTGRRATRRPASHRFGQRRPSGTPACAAPRAWRDLHAGDSVPPGRERLGACRRGRDGCAERRVLVQGGCAGQCDARPQEQRPHAAGAPRARRRQGHRLVSSAADPVSNDARLPPGRDVHEPPADSGPPHAVGSSSRHGPSHARSRATSTA